MSWIKQSMGLAFCLTLAMNTTARADDTREATGSMTPKQLAALIDTHIDGKLAEAKLAPSPLISDHGFLRRVSLDIRGTPPTADEVLKFVKNKDADKRAKVIARLFKDSGYAEHWSEIWNRALVGRGSTARRFIPEMFETWVEGQLAKNTPYDKMVTKILTAQGWADENGAVAYSLRYEVNPMELAATSSRQFLGVQIQCAQCHDHPYTDHKQKDFQGMAGYFGRVSQQRQRTAGRRRFGVRERPRGVLKINANGDPVKPRDWGKSVSPKFILKKLESSLDDGFRDAYASLITSPKNTYFSRMAVNRVWSILFGSGIINPIEDLEQGETHHPELLKQMARAFVKSGHDLQWLISGVAMSKTYQRDSRRKSSQEDPAKAAKRARKASSEEKRELAAQRAALERRLFARSELRPLSPEQIFRSVLHASGLEDLDQVRRRGGFRARKRQVLRQFLFTFESGDGQIEEFSGTIPQALLMMNSAFVNKTIELGMGRVGQILRDYESPKVRIQRIFLHVLARLPTSEETRAYTSHIRKNKNSKQSYEDIAWVLINSSEFLFNS